MSNKNLLDIILNDMDGDSKDSPYATEDKILLPLLEEINLINSQEIRTFVRAVLCKTRSFWVTPATRVAGVHPPDEYELGGNVLHTKRVVRTAILLAAACELTPEHADILLAAALLHDTTKALMFTDKLEDTIHDEMHPYTLDRMVQVYQIEDNVTATSQSSHTLGLDIEILSVILRLVRCSHGIWSPIPETIPETILDRLMHLSDFIASSVHTIIDGDDVQEWRWSQKKN